MLFITIIQIILSANFKPGKFPKVHFSLVCQLNSSTEDKMPELLYPPSVIVQTPEDTCENHYVKIIIIYKNIHLSAQIFQVT